MKYMRRTAEIHLDRLQKNAQIAKDLEITLILDKLLEYKTSWTQHVNKCLEIDYPGLWNTTPQLVDFWRHFWLRKTGTGQQVAQIHDRYMTMIYIYIYMYIYITREFVCVPL